MRRTISAMAVLALLLGACAAGDAVNETFSEIGSSLGGGDEPASNDGEDGTQTVSDADLTASNRVSLEIAVSDDRKVIRNASLQLASDDTRATFDEIVRIAESNGGFVENAEVSPTDERDQPFVNVTVRVPSASLTQALGEFKASADEVISESQGAEDVTETYIDLEARLANLTALEVELRALLEEVRKQPDSDPDKLLRVFTEISSTRGEIERIQGQLNFLSDAVDLATARISIEPTPQAVPIVEEGWAPSETARSATRTLVTGLQQLGDAAITFVIALLPMLILAIGIPGVFAYLLYRGWRSRRAGGATPDPVPNE